MKDYTLQPKKIKAIQFTDENIAEIHQILYGETIKESDRCFRIYKRLGFDLPKQSGVYLNFTDWLCQGENGNFFVWTDKQFKEMVLETT